MNKKIGRPTVSKSAAKTVLRGALFAPDEARAVDKAVKLSGQDKSKWLRKTAIVAAEQWERPALASDIFWGPLPYPEPEMDGKTLEFKAMIKLPDYKEPVLVSGIGQMHIRERPDGFHIRLIAPGSSTHEKVIDLTAKQAELITRQPTGAKAYFSLVATQL